MTRAPQKQSPLALNAHVMGRAYTDSDSNPQQYKAHFMGGIHSSNRTPPLLIGWSHGWPDYKTTLIRTVDSMRLHCIALAMILLSV